MEQLIISSFVSLYNSLPAVSPAYMDILKLIVGATSWIGGFVGFLYIRDKKLKAAASK